MTIEAAARASEMTRYEQQYYNATGQMPNYDDGHPFDDLWNWLTIHHPWAVADDRVWVDGDGWTPEFAQALTDWEQWNEAEARTAGLWD